MFTYRCPRCRKQHVLEEKPREEFIASCVRCHNPIKVPGSATAATTAAAVAALPPPATATHTTTLPEASPVQPAPNPERTDRIPSPEPEAPSVETTPAPQPENKPEPVPAAGSKSLKEHLRNRRVLVAGVLLVLLVGGAGAFFLAPGRSGPRKPAGKKPVVKKPVKQPPKVVKKDGTTRPPNERPPLPAGTKVIRFAGFDISLEKPPESRRLTADFLPHKPGTSRTYDVAMFVPGSPGKVVRQVWLQKEDGVTQTKTTHVGTLKGGSLFDPVGKNTVAKWEPLPRPIPGPVFHQRVSPEFVEIGEEVAMRQGTETVWQPRLKLGARAGDSWNRSHQGTEHRFTLVGFEQHDGLSAAVITETITPADSTPPLEVRRVYVQGVGEVERREWRRMSERERRLLSESKLVVQAAPKKEDTAGR